MLKTKRKATKKRKLQSDESEVEKPRKMKSVDKEESGNFISDVLPTREFYRDQLKIGICSRSIVLIRGPIGCGKTSIVKEVARSMDLPCRTIQMGEQIDSKSLFGTFQCLDIPGEFCWKESIFTKYLREKGVILLEDIDCASSDLISQVIDLCDHRKAVVTSGETIQMHDEAYIVATMRHATQERIFRSADIELLLSSVPFEITLPSFTNEELYRVICILYGRTAPFARKLITIFNEVVSSCLNSTNGRKLGATDLLKACARINELNDLSNAVTIFEELLDVWAVHCYKQEDYVSLAELIAGHLSLNNEQAIYQINLRSPEISMTRNELTIGRAKLRRECSVSTGRNCVSGFGLTRDICQLLERIAVCIRCREPVLLVGETGTGKTAVIQVLANYVGANLRVINLSQHSESSDLIGGYKPVSISCLLQPLKKEYYELFAATFDVQKNEKFLRHLDTCLSNGRYIDYLKLIVETARRTLKIPAKRDSAKLWAKLLVKAERCVESLKVSAVSFTYVRGAVSEAAERGEWVLIDEINLATLECLDSVVRLIEDSDSRHPSFRLFACMNPASDFGKRNLPVGIRIRFTEIFVRETTDMEQLHIIAHAYLPSADVTRISPVLELYQTLRATLPGKYSLRTLCRALAFAAENIFGNEARSLYEAVSMSFLSDLDNEAQILVENLIQSKLSKISMNKSTAKVTGNRIEVEGYWIEMGDEEPRNDPSYVCTPSVRKNLSQLARVVCSGKFPVLLEGETSCGKTAMVLYLAKITGNKITRINNHEHTDLQEYVGSYVPDSKGRFIFIEGPLVKAARDGYWVILDELNLASTDVIEAINRLIDDNRELFIPETNTVVKAHPRFRLFATQNPAAFYGGRKRLSRALINRFVVLRFSQLPYDEITQMVVVSCGIAPTAAQAMVSVFCDLRAQRSTFGVFSAGDGLMTFRDLFRWGRRLAGSDQSDWRQCVAEHGFFLLGARCRNAVDVECVKKTLEKNMNREIDIDRLFACDSPYLPDEFRSRVFVENIVLTRTIRRMLILVAQSWRFAESVLVVGETGCGKTTVAQMLAREKLLTLNCHERTEAADLLGSLRPVGDGSFQWMDGIVLQAMKEGRPLLLDEISLAPDSVLERLNPLLEATRSLFLNDGGISCGEVHPKNGFNVVATMNPGGDYGKRELSKALRNRFTEIWCPSDVCGDDLISIVERHLSASTLLNEDNLRDKVAKCIVHFVLWFSSNFSHVLRRAITIRDVVAVAELVTATVCRTNSASSSIFHAFSATLFDSFGTLSIRTNLQCSNLKKKAIDELSRIMRLELGTFYDAASFSRTHSLNIDENGSDGLTIGGFHVPFGPAKRFMPAGFTFDASTCKENVFRVARGLILHKPILLEGPPGCGKSSTVVALAAATGHPLTRLNLSEQTDLTDLFGCDVPVVLPDDTPSFAWKDGPILEAIKKGYWVLLDEMNLASQSVLEGLNACFDHRHQLFIPELNRTFNIGQGVAKTRFFACQNPCSQGGNRRELPKSFVNRFTSIYVDEMDVSDFFVIMKNSYGYVLSDDVIQRMINLNSSIAKIMAENRQFLIKGRPFEFNLRDLLRWAQLTVESGDVSYGFDLLYVWRLRSSADRQKMRNLFHDCFKFECIESVASFSINDTHLRIGKVELKRSDTFCGQKMYLNWYYMKLLSSQMKLLEKLAACVKMNWLSLIVGKAGSGKSTVVYNLSQLVGKRLHKMRLTSESDSLELLGSFEQISDYIDLASIKQHCLEMLKSYPDLSKDIEDAGDILALRIVLQSAVLIVRDDIGSELSKYEKQLSKKTMRFQWRNSQFVDAYRDGDWILIENVNCCSAAVLDRLNACLESNGELNLSESGDATSVLKAHTDFRVFFTMDDEYGEVSRAMRNRAVELYLLVEDCAWFKVSQDVVNIAMGSGMKDIIRITPAAKLALEQLSCWQLLKLNMLLKDMYLENALKLFEVSLNEALEGDVSEEETFIIYPTVEGDLVNKYNEWKVLVWSCISQHDWMLGLLWATISIPLEEMDVKKLVAAFKCEDKQVAKIVQIIQHWKRSGKLQYDERFDGPPLLRTTKSPSSYVNFNKFIIRMCALWAEIYLKRLQVEKESAVYLSNLFAKKKQRSDMLPLAVIANVKDLVDLLNTSVLEFVTVDCAAENSYMVLWNIVLFVEACHRQLTVRTACAPLHLAWQRLNDCYFRNMQHSVNIRRIANTLDNVWMADKVASERYAVFYKRCNFVVPFQSYDEWKKYNDALENALKSGTYFSPNQNSTAEQDSDHEKICPTDTNILLKNSLKVVEDVCCSFAIFSCSSGNEALLKLSSEASRCPMGLYHLAFLNHKDENWSRIACFAQLLSSDFAVDEFRNAHRYSDMAWIPLGSEFFSLVWRSMGFHPSLQKVTLGQLADFPVQQKHLSTYFWKIEAHLKSFKTKYRELLSTMADQFESLLDLPSSSSPLSSITLPQLMRRLEAAACALLPLSVPVSNCIDPMIRDEVISGYLTNKIKLMENILHVLQMYHGVVSNQRDLALFSNSRHPLIKNLLSVRTSALEEMENYLNNSVAFRPRYTDFYSLISAMNSLVVTLLDRHRRFCLIDIVNMDNLSYADTKMMVAQMDSFLTLVQSFCDRTIFEYSAFPDVICPFFMFMNIVVATVSYKRLHLLQLLNLRDLNVSSGFPTNFVINWDFLRNCPQSDVLYKWCISERTAMPKRLQKDLVAYLLQQNKENENFCDIATSSIIRDVIRWIGNEWSKWFEANTEKQEESYVYRKSRKHEEGRNEDDTEMLDLLPNFSSLDDVENDMAETVSSVGYIDGEDLVELLYLLLGEEISCYDGHMALAWIIDTVSACGRLDDTVDLKFFVHNLSALNKYDMLDAERILDVYRKNSRSELVRCISALKPLMERIRWLKEIWPEMTVLDDILQRAQKLLSTPITVPLMHFAALLERLLVEAELWEKVADRKHSIQPELDELRHLLVDWRKMEIVCWDNLLERVQMDCRTQALLMSWPLIEALGKGKSDDEILTLTIEWIQNSTLADFKARLMTVKLINKFILLSEETTRNGLCRRLQSVMGYFQQFFASVESKIAVQKEPVEKQLHDFVKIMKYNDLNLWSVKKSAQKAHHQLFRLIKQFKLLVNEPVGLLFDEMLPTSWVERASPSTFACGRLVTCNDFYAKRAVELAVAIVSRFSDGFHFEDLHELVDYVNYCNGLIRKDIQYEGDNDAKEKQQGHALSERQNAVARLFKNSGMLGLNSRKGLIVQSEQLTADVVAGIVDNDMLAKYIRHGGASRNIVLKKFHRPNAQLSTRTMCHLKGLTEFILNDLNLTYQTVRVTKGMLKQLEQMKKILNNYWENVKELEKPCINGQQWLRFLQSSKYSLLKFCSVLKFMRTKLENAPDDDVSNEDETFKFSNLADSRLSQLHKHHPEYVPILDTIKKLQEAGIRLNGVLESSLFSSSDCESIMVWKYSEISRVMETLRSENTAINIGLSTISSIMCEEVEEAFEFWQKVAGTLDEPTGRISYASWNGTETLLITLQNIYKQALSADFDNSCFMDILKHLRVLLERSQLDKSVETLWNLCKQLSFGATLDSGIEQIVSLCTTIFEIFSYITDLSEECAIGLAQYYIEFEALAATLLEKGYVNPIPKFQEGNEKDNGTLESSDDNVAGIGDASGDRDVGESIDETGQVEGLRGDDEINNEEGGRNDNDTVPLDMDQDFGGNLDDADHENSSDNEENGDENHPELNEEMGVVDQCEENKLDPDLWNENEGNEKELTEGNEGACKTMDNVTAANEDENVKSNNEALEMEQNSENDNLENVDEREPPKSDDIDDSIQIAEKCDGDNGVGDTDETKSEDNFEDSVNNELDEIDDLGSDDQGGIATDMNEITSDSQENVENNVEQNNDTVEGLEQTGDQVMERGADGMEVGTQENMDHKDSELHSDVLKDSTSMEEKGSANGTEGSGMNGYKEVENENVPERQDEVERIEKTSEKAKDLADDIVDLAMQETSSCGGEQREKESSDYGPADKNSTSLFERVVIDKSSVEEAKSSKENVEQLEKLDKLNVDLENDEVLRDVTLTEENENDSLDIDMRNSEIYNSVIHTATDFYHLVEPSTSTNLENFVALDEQSTSPDASCEERWNKISDSVALLAAEFAETLRMIIEPTVASRFQGDYRTGKRLNMRRLIAYIASGYRKDKIWLRRTKKTKHNYRILIAVDDSASMHDNKMKLKACQSVAVIESGLRRLELGQLAICKFGASVKLISDFGTGGDSVVGGKLINELNFGQDRTDLVTLLKCSRKIFAEAQGSYKNEQMLIIVSDGRGVLADGVGAIKKALSELHADQITVLFVAIDNGKKSVVDMKVAEFTDNGGVNLIPYMQKFPFPFYIVVRHLAMLPATIGDAVRQWFELTAQDL